MIFGCDTSIANFGISICRYEGQMVTCELATTIHTRTDHTLQKRCGELFDELRAFAYAYPITAFSIEDPELAHAAATRKRTRGTSVTTTRLFQAVGVVRVLAHQMGLPLYEYEPDRLKQVVLCNSRSSKNDVVTWCRKLVVGVPDVFSEHAAHATCAAMLGLRETKGTRQ